MNTDKEFAKKRPIIHRDATGNFTISNLQSINYYRVAIEANGTIVGTFNVKHIEDIKSLLSTWKLVNSFCSSSLPKYRFLVTRSNTSREFELTLDDESIQRNK